jgi:hypothetical protein
MLRSAWCRLKSPFKGIDPFRKSSGPIAGAFLLASRCLPATALLAGL